jgi:hypothetical protein
MILLVRRGLAGLLACVALNGCASLELIHDPQTGVIGRSEVPRFLKSVRCELSTFYHANLLRRSFFEKKAAEAQRIKLQADRTGNRALLEQAEALRAEAVTDGIHFPIAPDLFGGVYMDLKVVDTVGIGAGDASFVNKQVRDAAHSETYGITPVLNTQNTYEMVYSFLIDQGAGLSGTAVVDPFKCYDSALLKPGVTAIMLAYDAAPETLQYTRILVNGQRPLAAWLLDNAEQTWVNFRAKHEEDEAERLIPVQMNYSFTVQVSGGVNVRYTLTSPIWSPAQIGGGAGAVQSSQMSIYLNGEDANLAGGAKLGSAVNKLGHRVGTRRFVANPEHRALKAELAKTMQELNTLQVERELQKTGKSIEGGPTLLPQSTERLDERIRNLEGQRRQIQERLNKTPEQKEIVVPAPGGRAGNVRGYLNSPIGIAPPPN